MSTKLKMSRTTIWEWKHDPRFCRWYDSEFTQTIDLDWPLIIRKHEMLAMRGSVRCAEFLAKVRYASANLRATHRWANGKQPRLRPHPPVTSTQ